MRENFLTSDLSISGNFKQLCILWQKAPPPTPPQMREKFLTSDLSISGNFEQLWFLWQKSPPPGWRKIFWHQIYPFQAILSNFGFCGRKAPPPMRDNFLTSDLSISGNFEQLWFLWQKSPPPPQWGKIFDFRSIHFRQLWATLVFVAEKPPHPPPDEGQFFDFRSIHFRQLWATLVFVAEKPPPPWGKIFDFRSIHFRQFRATLVFVAEKPPSFLPFLHGPGLWHIGRIPKVPILQIHTQIPPIRISSIGYQLCQLFKILTYTELQDSGSCCIWKAYRQPYHNTH